MQYENLGKFIKNKRLSMSSAISLNRFAIENGIEPAILSRIENGKQDIKFGVLVKIANGFDMPVSALIKEYEEKFVNFI